MDDSEKQAPDLENGTANAHDGSSRTSDGTAVQPNEKSHYHDPPLRYKPKPQYASPTERLQHFTWCWFACTMSTGVVAVVLANTPFRFSGLDVIAKIFFILDLVLFMLFCCAIAYRFLRRPRVFIRSLHHPKEALFFGSFWVSVALILNLTQTYGVPVCGPWLVSALRVLYWIYIACSLLVAIFQYATLFVAERLPVDSAMPAWVMPVYSFLVVGPLAAIMVQTQPEAHHRLSIWVSAVMVQGLGWTVAVFMYTIYFLRLMSSHLPDPSTRPGMFIGVGPVGYTSAALVSLGNVASTVIPAGWLSVNTVAVGDIVKIVAVMAGIFLWLVAFWFFALSSVAVAAGAFGKQKMGFTLNWWAFIFPNAGMTLAAINIGNVLQSDGVKAVTSAMTVLLVVAWLVVAVCNVHAVVNRIILWEGKDEDEGMHLD